MQSNEDFLTVDAAAQLTLLIAFRQRCGINDGVELQEGDEVAWLEKLYSLEDNRLEA
jgi:hypothetical protein